MPYLLPSSLSLSSLSECVVVRLLKSMHADSTGRDDDDSIYTYITRQTGRLAGRTPVAIADKQLLLPICMAAAAIRQTIANLITVYPTQLTPRLHHRLLCFMYCGHTTCRQRLSSYTTAWHK